MTGHSTAGFARLPMFSFKTITAVASPRRFLHRLIWLLSSPGIRQWPSGGVIFLLIFLADSLSLTALCGCDETPHHLGDAPVNRQGRRRQATSICSGCESLEPRLPLAVVTIQSAATGKTPDATGYNLGHFMPGTNAADWFSYSGVRAARAFISPSDIEPSDDIAGTGDGVVDQATFMARRSALRANAANPSVPLDNNFINWPAFRDRYANALGDTNRFTIDSAFSQLRSQGVELLANITASPSRFPLAGDSDWSNKWELWQHYYAQGFYLSNSYAVQRFSMFNEPNNWTGMTPGDWQQRLSIASDALQTAVMDVNARYGKSLTARIFAPNTANGSTKYIEWGQQAVQNRHVRVDGTTDPDWSNLQVYNFQKYSMYARDTGTASGYVNDLQELRTFLAPDTINEPLPLALTEYNVRTASSYDGRSETLDSPSDYAALGVNSIALAQQDVREFYLFKFAQTERTGGAYPVTKNGTHYVRNGTSGPNNYGGATRAAEVYRLFNKAAAPGRDQLAFTSDAGTDVWTLVTWDPASKTYYAFVTNNGTTAVPLDLDVTALGVPAGNAAIIEEVSENFSGGVTRVAAVAGGKVPAGTLPPQTVWLVSIPSQAQSTATISASADTVLADGISRNTPGGTATSLLVRADGTVDGRRVTLLKFPTSSLTPANLQRVLLSINVSAAAQTGTAQAHLYGLQDDAWNEATTWSGLASALQQNTPAGNQIGNNVVTGQGTTTRILGQITAGASAAERQFDVTEFVRSQTDGFASFLIVQEHRWDVALPSLTAGDTQADGLRISSRETTSGPQLKVFSRQTNAPRIVTQPANQTVTEGQPVTFSVSATGTGVLTYKWSRNGVEILGATTASYTTTATTLADSGSRWAVTVTNEFGSVTSSDAVLTVQAATKFFVVDNAADRTYRYGSTGTFISSSAAATNNLNALGIASNPDGSRLWIIDSNKTVYVYNAAMTLLGSWTPGGLRTPNGISVAGNDVWIVDAGTKKASVFTGAASRISGTQNAARSVTLDKNNNAPQDIVADSTTLWVTQSGTVDRVFVYQAASGAALGNWTIDTRNTSPVGITLDPSGVSTSLWIVDNTTDTVYEYANARSRRSGSQPAVRTFPLTAGNGNPQGIADPPPPALTAPNDGDNSDGPTGRSKAVTSAAVVPPNKSSAWPFIRGSADSTDAPMTAMLSAPEHRGNLHRRTRQAQNAAPLRSEFSRIATAETSPPQPD
ncbi:MAG: hypothetical protein RLZZ436_3524, partial [Planctomycetota bacterium]